MTLKEHPFVVTCSFTADGDTITYNKQIANRSTAVGKAFTINADGKAVLVTDGDEVIGKVLAVDDDNIMTGAYICGGLRLPLGKNAVVARGDKIVGALGARNGKGFVKPVLAPPESVPTDAKEDYTDSDVQNNNGLDDAINATNTALNTTATAVNSIGAIVNKGRGLVVDFDDTDALVALI